MTPVLSHVLYVVVLVAVMGQALASPKTTSYSDAALLDNIKEGNLPGLSETLGYGQYSGYLTVTSGSSQRKIFYWFVESQNEPSTDPVVFWTNGGPGCSGLIGFMEEHGPFSPNEDGATLSVNSNSWNTIANMVYIEAPVGVGYSYSNNTDDYTVGDHRTASDNYNAIINFFEKFPSLVSNELYIASESYGGHYMPTLAWAIVQGNKAGVNQYLNFKGFMVGNPYTDTDENLLGMYGAFWGHSMISRPVWEGIQSYCLNSTSYDSDQCYSYQDQAYDQVGDIDPYALDYPACETSSGMNAQVRHLLSAMPRYRNRAASSFSSKHASLLSTQHKTRMSKQRSHKMSSGRKLLYSYDPCRENYASTYLNTASVMEALHVDTSVISSWSACSSSLNYSMYDSDQAMEPYYRLLLAVQEELGLKMLVYSGDDDSVCGPLGTQQWIWALGLDVKSAWTPWYYDQQVAGYITKFQGLTYATVHDAGHLVPAEKSEQGLTLLTMFLNGTLFDY